MSDPEYKIKLEPESDVQQGGHFLCDTFYREDNECSHCSKIFKSKVGLLGHIKLKHPTEPGGAKCEICDKRYSSLLSLQKHVYYMHRFRHRCPGCYRSFPSEQSLIEHKVFCRSRINTTHPCNLCVKQFNSQLALNTHVKYNHIPESNTRCDFCRRTFANKRTLNNHINIIHPNKHFCKACDIAFDSVGALKVHDVKEHEVKCTLCHKTFRSWARHERHVEEFHGVHVHRCGICQRVLKTEASLLNHTRVVHQNSAWNRVSVEVTVEEDELVSLTV